MFRNCTQMFRSCSGIGQYAFRSAGAGVPEPCSGTARCSGFPNTCSGAVPGFQTTVPEHFWSKASACKRYSAHGRRRSARVHARLGRSWHGLSRRSAFPVANFPVCFAVDGLRSGLLWAGWRTMFFCFFSASEGHARWAAQLARRRACGCARGDSLEKVKKLD